MSDTPGLTYVNIRKVNDNSSCHFRRFGVCIFPNCYGVCVCVTSSCCFQLLLPWGMCVWNQPVCFQLLLSWYMCVCVCVCVCVCAIWSCCFELLLSWCVCVCCVTSSFCFQLLMSFYVHVWHQAVIFSCYCHGMCVCVCVWHQIVVSSCHSHAVCAAVYAKESMGPK